MKRASVTADVTAPFVEPTSVTVVCAPLAAKTFATWSGSVATGAATTASSAPSTASSRDEAGPTAPRSPAVASASGSTSQPRTSPIPAARAASPTDAPISPVPTTASERTDIELLCRTHELGDAKREIERLPRVQPRIAERHVAGIELRLLHVLGAAETLGDVVARELEVNAARPRPGLPMRGEEAFDLPQHVVEVPRLSSAGAREHVRVHRIADPHDRMLRLANGAEDGRQELE